ncbi:MAG: YncE family protein, partial [Acidobacteriia bacterium]|nr:YncE family protein [Terriglobia bacterium]
MKRHNHFRVYFLLTVLLVAGLVVLLREHRPSFLRPGLRLNAYVSTDDGSVTVMDLVRLRVETRVAVGPAISGLVEHPTRAEVWGVSTAGGYVWILDAKTNQIAARIPVGASPYAVAFSADGARAYVSAAGGEALLVIDCATRQIT